MARILGVELQDNWKIDYALTRLKGIGWTLSRKILMEMNFKDALRLKDLNADDLAKLTARLEEFPVEGELIRRVRMDIQRLRDIGSYRGVRHNRGLPVNGQRTKSNARTKRGKRKTVGAFKKEVLSKLTTGKKEETK